MNPLFVTAARGLQNLLAHELKGLGATDVREAPAGVSCTADLDTTYRICLWTRLASRVLLQLTRFQFNDADELYEGARQVCWEDHIGKGTSIAVDCTKRGKSPVDHTHFAALRCKDAVVDRIRDQLGWRPDTDPKSPDMQIAMHMDRNQASVYLDMGLGSLHLRGYRQGQGGAPLKENLAAAVLLRSQWPGIAANGGSLADPLCGSGTLLIEGAFIAADRAPALSRPRFGFDRWQAHVPTAWRQIKEEADERARAGLASMSSRFYGADRDPAMVAAAKENARLAGLEKHITVTRSDLASWRCPPEANAGLVVTNAPYGERLSSDDDRVYRNLGRILRQEFSGWKAGVLCGSRSQGRALGIRASKLYPLPNGPIESVLVVISDIAETSQALDERAPISSEAQMFRNRLLKNQARLTKRLRREQISCYRLYDADLPEFAASIDMYEGHAHVQEYEPPRQIPEKKAARRRRELLQVVSEALEVQPDQVHYKLRRRQRGESQYEASRDEGTFFVVNEGGLKFWVNLDGYIDTGLFLDHRPTRKMIADACRGKRFLNLFAYTGSFSVYAAAGGAASTTSVDLSRTYCEWAGRNLELNGFLKHPGVEVLEGPHQIVRADCWQWLRSGSDQFDLIFLDPPTFSNSKRMEKHLDLVRDHEGLIRAALARLTPEGTLYFSTNARKLDLHADSFAAWNVQDLTHATVPFDFSRTPTAHRLWKFSAKD